LKISYLSAPSSQLTSLNTNSNTLTLLLSEQERGNKIYRTAKRVSGQLLTLIVFELHPAPISHPKGERHERHSASLVSEGGSYGTYTDLTLASGSVGDMVGGDSLVSPSNGSATDNGAEGGTDAVVDGNEAEESSQLIVDEYNTGHSSQSTDIPAVPVYTAPLFRVIAYDPKSRRKIPFFVPSGALLELAGGLHSQYLAPER
jgi:hypothetical protein